MDNQSINDDYVCNLHANEIIALAQATHISVRAYEHVSLTKLCSWCAQSPLLFVDISNRLMQLAAFQRMLMGWFDALFKLTHQMVRDNGHPGPVIQLDYLPWALS